MRGGGDIRSKPAPISSMRGVDDFDRVSGGGGDEAYDVDGVIIDVVVVEANAAPAIQLRRETAQLSIVGPGGARANTVTSPRLMLRSKNRDITT